jgi:uncharacterized protein (TIGR02147 family)
MVEAKRVFHFSDPVDFLNDCLRERRRRNPNFSLSAWARQLGYENPSFLSQVLKRQRKLKMNLVAKLARDLDLRGKSLRYFEFLALQGGSKTESERRIYGGLAKQVRPKKLRFPDEFPVELFGAVSDWYHAALIEAVHLKDFREDAEAIRRRLQGKVDRRTIRAAIDRLVELGRLARDEKGRLHRGLSESALVRTSLPSEAVKNYHFQMIDLARAAIRGQPVSDRYLRGTTIPIRRADYEKAVKIVENAHRQLQELGVDEGADDIYQLNSQLFRLTRRAKSADEVPLH